MMRWFVRSIPPGEPILAISRSSKCSTTSVTKAWNVLSCMFNSAYKICLTTNRKRVTHEVAATGFLSLTVWILLICLTPYNRR